MWYIYISSASSYHKPASNYSITEGTTLAKTMVSNLPLRVVHSLLMKNFKELKKNPKRMQRETKKQMQNIGIGTKSQQALKLQHEQNKQERKVRSKEQKEAEAQRLFELKQKKRLEKHKGH